MISLFKEKADSYFTIITDALERNLNPLEKIKTILVNIIEKMETDDQFMAEELLMMRRADNKAKFHQIHDYIKQRTEKHSELLLQDHREGQKRGEIKKRGRSPACCVSLVYFYWRIR